MEIKIHIRCKLSDFELKIDWEGQEDRIGILGASGSGKSMTLKAIAGIITPDEGSIIVDDVIFFDSEKKINLPPQKRKIGYLFQNYALFPTMTVRDNIKAGLQKEEVHWWSNARKKKEIEDKVDEMLRRFQIKELEKRYPHELSGGQQQRVALARIMAYEPKLLMLDEPFSALDSHLKDHMKQQMSELLEEYKGTLVLVSHSRDEIYNFTKHLIIIKKGKIVEAGDTQAVFAKPQFVESAILTGCKNISPIEKIDDRRILATKYGIELHIKEQIGQYVTHIGFRAHDIMETNEAGENRFPFEVAGVTKAPFETVYFIRPLVKEQMEEKICYKKSRQLTENEKKLASFLEIPPESLIFLKN